MRPEVEFWSAWLYTMLRGYTLFLEYIRGKNRVCDHRWLYTWLYIFCVVIRPILPKQPYYAKKSDKLPQGAARYQILAAKILKTVGGSVTCQMGRNINSTRAFRKCITWKVAAVESPIRKNKYFIYGDRHLVTIGLKICMTV